MFGVDLYIVPGPIPSVEASLPAEEAEEWSGSESGADTDFLPQRPPCSEGHSGPAPRPEGRSGPAPRLVEVMLALSGRIDVEEPAAPSADEIDGWCSHTTLERLAMLGQSLGL